MDIERLQAELDTQTERADYAWRNASHEGPGAASSRTVPLDAVVGRRR